MQPQTLDPSAAVGLYVKLGGGEWLYRGCVHNGHPTEVMPLQVGGGGEKEEGRGVFHSLFTPNIPHFPTPPVAGLGAGLPDTHPRSGTNRRVHRARLRDHPQGGQQDGGEGGLCQEGRDGSVQVWILTCETTFLMAWIKDGSSAFDPPASYLTPPFLPLLRYMESFQTMQMGDQIVVPANLCWTGEGLRRARWEGGGRGVESGSRSCCCKG